MGSAEPAEVGIRGFFSLWIAQDGKGWIWGGLILGAAGERGLKSLVADNGTFPLEHLPHCLGSSECQEGLWRSYDMIPRTTTWFWVCKVGKQRCPGCTLVHKHTSFVKTPRSFRHTKGQMCKKDSCLLNLKTALSCSSTLYTISWKGVRHLKSKLEVCYPRLLFIQSSGQNTKTLSLCRAEINGALSWWGCSSAELKAGLGNCIWFCYHV